MTVLERVDLDELSRQARDVQFGRTLLALAAFVLISIGKLAGYAWLVPVWCALAVREGWREVHPPQVSREPARPR